MVACLRHMLVLALVGGCVGPVAACSGPKGDPIGNGSINGGAEAECNALTQKYCEKSASCHGEQTSDCIARLNAEFEQEFGQDCSGADQTGATYDQCMAELENLTCADAPFPASCDQTILFAQ